MSQIRNKADQLQSAEPLRTYYVAAAGYRQLTLPELINWTKIWLDDKFRITNLSTSEGLILRHCVEETAMRSEDAIKSEVPLYNQGEFYIDAGYHFLQQAYGIDQHLLDEVITGQPGCGAIAVWIENVRNEAHSNGLDSRPLYEKRMARQLKPAGG